MSDETPISPATQTLIRAMSHPVQPKILIALAEGGDATSAQIAERSNTPVRSVRHHLSQLEKAGLVGRTASEKRRGVHQHYYRLLRPPHLGTKETETLNAHERLRISTEALKNTFIDVSASLAAGELDKRSERCVAHVRMQVDEQGWQELARLHVKTWEEAERVKAESAERLSASNGQTIRAASTVMFYELPPIKA